jgi:hypothetical protein
MGLRFDLRVANWLAFVLDGRAPVPLLGEEREEHEALISFVESLEGQFHSSLEREELFESLVLPLKLLVKNQEPPQRLLSALRSFFGGRRWTALLLPSGGANPIDRYLCSKKLLRDLISIRPKDPGLILQLQEPPEQIFSLTNVFPAFRTALSASSDWPGVLIWTQGGDSVFLPLGTDLSAAHVRAHWIFSHLSTRLGADLELLKSQFMLEFAEARMPASSRLTIVHLSDIHLGSRAASLRLPRIQDILANLINDLGEYAEAVIPLVSGDLMDNPDEDNLDRVRAFLGFLSSLGTEKPIVLLGNHDVRRNGYLSDDLKMAMQINDRSDAVRWFDDFKVAIACFDSVRNGKLARGSIGERQLLDMGSKLDEKCRGQHEYVVLAALHHHPIPVTIPEWYSRPFYERVLGKFFEKTDELEDAHSFVAFAEARRIAAILHGHKHIPRIDPTQAGIPVIGCGSSVGKVRTRDDSNFMSINMLTLNTSTKVLSARLLAERVAGGGMVEYQKHEIVWSPKPAPTYNAQV